MNSERINVFTYSLLSRIETTPGLPQSEKKVGARSKLHMYDTLQRALEAARENLSPSVFAIVIIQQLATLPENQIKRLHLGLPWSSRIDSSEINLQRVKKTEYPVAPKEHLLKHIT